MAYMNQEKKAKIASKLKEVMPKDWKYSLSVQNHSTIICTITQAPVDIIEEYNRVRQSVSLSERDYCQVNPYHYKDQFNQSLPIIESIIDALNLDNYDKSDIMSDCFDVGHYVRLNIGRYNKPFVYTGA